MMNNFEFNSINSKFNIQKSKLIEVILFQLVALVLLALGLMRGLRLGFTRLVPSMVALTVAAICSHIFTYPVSIWLSEMFPAALGRPGASYLYSVFASAIVFGAFYLLFLSVLSIVGKVLSSPPNGILGYIGGACYGLFRALLFLSIAYNMILAIFPSSPLHKAMKSDDGNIVEGVLLVSSPIIGSESPEEFAHALQLDDAKKIS